MTSLLFVCATATLSFSLLAQETKPAAPAPARPNAGERMARPDRPRPQSQAGKIIGVDKSASAITVGPMEGAPAQTALTSNVVVQVSTNTIFFKNSKKVTLDDVAVGDPVRFMVRKTPDGKQVAAYIAVGPLSPVRPAPKAPAEKPPVEKK